MSASLSGKVAIVTGASSGIGQTTAITLAKNGAKVVLVGRNLDNLHKTEADCKTHGNETLVVQADVTKERDMEQLVKTTVEKLGQIDILVNNAGIIKTGSVQDTSMAAYDDVMNANVRSIFHLTSLCVPYLEKTKGNIVNVSSVNGIRSFAGCAVYCMSKAAVDQFTRCCALDLAPKQIRVNSVNPGVIVTDIHKRGGMSDEQYQQFLERGKSTHALGRVGETQEVADAILFLASSSSSFVTGASLPVDGGRHAMCPR